MSHFVLVKEISVWYNAGMKEIRSDISFEEYKKIKAVNKSSLDDLIRSPLHFYAKHIDENREAREETPAMRLGTAIHTATLEPAKFNEVYAVMSEGLDRRTKEGKAEFAELEMTGKKILTFNESMIAGKVASQVRLSSTANELLEDGKSEQTILWTDEETGVPCKARADFISSDFKIVVDLKSAEDARREAFSRSCAEYGYHRQAAWYLKGVGAASGVKPELFLFIVFEKAPPFACAFYYASPEMIIEGEKENTILLRQYKKAVDENHWEGYSQEIQPIDLPAWKMKQSEQTKTTELEKF